MCLFLVHARSLLLRWYTRVVPKTKTHSTGMSSAVRHPPLPELRLPAERADDVVEFVRAIAATNVLPPLMKKRRRLVAYAPRPRAHWPSAEERAA